MKLKYPMAKYGVAEPHTIERSRAAYFLRLARNRGRAIERRARGYFIVESNLELITKTIRPTRAEEIKGWLNAHRQGWTNLEPNEIKALRRELLAIA